MKNNKRILIIILALITFAGSLVGIWHISNQGRQKFDSKNLSVFEDNDSSFYLQRVDKDIIFKVQCDGNAVPDFTLVDEEGNTVQAKTRKTFNKCYNILPPSKGYSEGEQYTLSLANGVSFYSENLKDVQTLVFSIEKEKIESYEFTDAVVQVDTVVENAVNDTLDVENLNVSIGDIIYGQDENNESVVYKVTDIDTNGVATVTTPAIDEIYSDLEVYGEYTWDVDDIVSNPDLEVEIIENVKQSSFFDALMITAYADDAPEDAEFEVSIDPHKKDNSLEIEIKITLKPGENGLFGISKLKNQKVSITLNTNLALTTNCDIESVKDWDISASLTNDFSWKVDLSFYNKDVINKNSDLEELFSEENKFADLINYHKNVKNITEKLDKLSADVTAGEIKLFKWKLPVPSVPGLYFSTDIKLFAELDIAADATISHSIKTDYVVGLYYKKGDFKTYSNTFSDSKDISLSLSGKANAKAGIKLSIKATLIHDKVGCIKFEPQAGMYADFYVTYPISKTSEINDDNFAHSYFEPGFCYSAKVSATLNLIAKKLEFSYNLAEKKAPIDLLTFGNEEIALGIIADTDTIGATDMTVSVPDIIFEYFDVTKGAFKTEKLSVEDLEFTTDDGTKLDVVKGKITLPGTSTEVDTNITATYLHTDDQFYSTTFRVLVLGSDLEEEAPDDTQDSLIVTNFDADYIQHIPPYNYFFYIKDGKYGVLNMNGEIHVPAEYDDISVSDVRYEGNAEWSSNEGRGVVHLFDSDLSDSQEYTGYWLELDGTLTKGQLYGYGMDSWSDIYWDSKNNCAVVCNIILGGGVEEHYVYSYKKYLKEYDAIKDIRYTFIQSFNGFKEEDEMGLGPALFPNVTNEKYGLFDLETGKMITDFIYEDFRSINNNISVVSINNEWRLIDSTGKYVDSNIYDAPYDYSNEVYQLFYGNNRPFTESNGYVVVKINGKYGLMNTIGNQIIEPIYKGISRVSSDGYCWVNDDVNGWCLKNINSLT